SSAEEVVMAYETEESRCSQKGQEIKDRSFDLHTWIRIKTEDVYTKQKTWVITTVGRVIFNTILPKEMGYQNVTFDKGKLNDLAMQSYKKVGQARTAVLLDDIKSIGFKYATKAGITFSFSDIIVPEKKQEIIDETEKQVEEIYDIYQNGGITENERSSRIIDKWKMATEKVTEALMEDLVKDRDGFNSIYMMYLSGARGGKDQIKQLGAMRGLMAKPSKSTSSGEAEIIESPIKSNFKEGLTVLEYFISTHGARKGLADTALKTADAGYLTRRLVDVAQNAIITSEDCGTIEGLVVSPLKEGLETVQSLKDRIEGRFAAEDVRDPLVKDPITGEDKIIVHMNEYIDEEKATIIQQRGIYGVKIRSVLTCEEEKGLCMKCYGKNLGNNKLVKIGEPVGVIAAQSIGEPGTQLTLRTFHIGGTASTDIERAEANSNYDGIVKFDRMNYVINTAGEYISVSHLGRIQIIDEKDPSLVQEEYKVEYAAKIDVRDGQKIAKNTRLFSWDNYNNPLITTSAGTVKFENFQKDLTYKEEFNDLTGQREITIIESKDRRIQPQIAIVSPDRKKDEKLLLPTGLILEVNEGDHVNVGDILGKSTRITIKQRDITGGLPRVQDLFEAREPKDKALVSFISGRVTIGDLTKSGRVIYVSADSGEEEKYIVPPGKRIIVHQGDIVESGDALSDGALDSHDILKAKGIKAAQFLILNEVQEVYRKQGVKIDDKHVSVIIRQMFNKVRITNPGYTNFLEGEVVDKTVVLKENKRIESIDITREGKVLEIEEKVAKFEQMLLGITKASLLTDSWLSAAAFQETPRVLTEAAIEGKLDYLEGLKESIILGHRIPVGTGTKIYNEMVQKEIKNGKSIKEIIQMFAHGETVDEQEESIDNVLDY
ncbi:MAG: DNA-directed RNA polymerase subunit beta', partial [Candidatus Cloacimonetes bacterium]|nr:DNA-directed RNA polymerase subunit beta' [Candidatus Cloacimonadota bacterium]